MSTDDTAEGTDLGAELAGCDTWGHCTETVDEDEDGNTTWRCTACGAEGWDD